MNKPGQLIKSNKVRKEYKGRTRKGTEKTKVTTKKGKKISFQNLNTSSGGHSSLYLIGKGKGKVFPLHA
jgi:hypothetical protein